MEEGNGKRELSTGLEEEYMEEEGWEDSLKQEMYADSSDDSGTDTMSPVPIHNE